jgi:hypothetical protein
MPTARLAMILVLGGTLTGCGGGYVSPPPPVPPSVLDAGVNGQYSLMLTSTNGRGTTNIYTNITQTGKSLAGGANTLVCPSNDPANCDGNNAPAVTITSTGTVNGAKVTLTVSYPRSGANDTVTLVGTATGADLAGTYTDSLGDAGSWVGNSIAQLTGTYTGTYNSSSNPLPITPNISIALTQTANFQLTGTATITNSPCISSLTFSGQAIGGAFSLSDSVNGAALVTLPDGNNFNFSYNFDTTAAHCAGDFGRGVVVPNKGPWDY